MQDDGRFVVLGFAQFPLYPTRWPTCRVQRNARNERMEQRKKKKIKKGRKESCALRWWKGSTGPRNDSFSRAFIGNGVKRRLWLNLLSTSRSQLSRSSPALFSLSRPPSSSEEQTKIFRNTLNYQGGVVRGHRQRGNKGGRRYWGEKLKRPNLSGKLNGKEWTEGESRKSLNPFLV